MTLYYILIPIVSTSIFFGIMFEIYSYYFRSFSHKNKVLSTVVSNWVLYISRICNVVTMMSLALILELTQVLSQIFNIFFLVYLFSFFYTYFILYKFRVDIFFIIVKKIIKVLYKININYNNHKIKKYPITYKLPTSSFLVTLFVFFSLISPVIIGYHFFDFRMTLTYTASVFNFLASGILLSYIEPSFASKIKNNLYQGAFYNIFFGKIFALICISLIALILNYFFKI
jgi:hypothetical protein